MKTILKGISWFAVVFGALAIFGSLSPTDGYGLFGGALFAVLGIIALLYVREVEGK